MVYIVSPKKQIKVFINCRCSIHSIDDIYKLRCMWKFFSMNFTYFLEIPCFFTRFAFLPSSFQEMVYKRIRRSKSNKRRRRIKNTTKNWVRCRYRIETTTASVLLWCRSVNKVVLVVGMMIMMKIIAVLDTLWNFSRFKYILTVEIQHDPHVVLPGLFFESRRKFSCRDCDSTRKIPGQVVISFMPRRSYICLLTSSYFSSRFPGLVRPNFNEWNDLDLVFPYRIFLLAFTPFLYLTVCFPVLLHRILEYKVYATATCIDFFFFPTTFYPSCCDAIVSHQSHMHTLFPWRKGKKPWENAPMLMNVLLFQV